MATKRVGILTSGDDVPGLHSVMDSVVDRGNRIDCEVDRPGASRRNL